MAKISSYPILSDPTISDILIGTDVEDLNITKNFSIGSIIDIVGDQFVPYVGAIGNVNLGAFNITSSAFIVPGGLSSQFLKANGTLDSTVYVPAARTLTINSVTYDLSANRSWNLNTIDTLTTLGTSGAATYIGKTLNIPQYQAQGNYITQLSGEATAVGPGNATVTLSNLAVISKILTGLNITGGTLTDTDSILTAFGKVQNQINGLAGGVTYQGTWNAATNTPTLTSSVGTKGYYYVVSVPGNTNLNGITDWKLGDWAIFNGSIWEKVDNTDAVVSVNGYTGAVVLTFSDVGAPPATRTLTINGTTFDLTANRSWTVGDVRTDQTYSNPTWISSLAWGKITGTPTTLAGYGITDGASNTTTLTINGTTFDLSANRTWNVGTVTSVGTSGPLTGGTITGSGTIGITQAGASSDGYLSSTDWNTFNNKQNALTNPVTGTGTIFTLPMWSGATSLVDSPLSYGPDTFNFQYNSATGGTVNFTNIGLTSYTYSIQMNNFGSPRSTVHSYTDGVVVQSIGGTQVSRVFSNGNTILGAGVVDNGYKLEISGNLYVNSIVNATTDTDRFIVSDGGLIKYRTGAQLLSDIGAVPTTRQLTINGTAYDLSADRSWSVGTVTSVGLSMPSAFTVSNSPVTSAGTLTVVGAGTAAQYVRGDGTLGDFPGGGGGGGASVSYYLNGSVNQGTFVGNTYYEMNKVPIFGAGTDFNINTNGYIAQFITDANDPDLLLIPGGNWNLEFYFSASSGGGSPTFYVELYKYNGTTFTLIASNSTNPELISLGTTINPYFSTLGVPETVLAATDRLAIRIYVTNAGRTITLHTENSHLCQVITTFTTGLTALNGITKQVQYLTTGTSGTDFNIVSSVDTHTFNLPTASAVNRGALSASDWSTFNAKMPAITFNAPLFIASGGDVGITQASGSTNGFLSSTDWNTFNNKQNALTNPVTGTGTTNVVPKFTGTSTIGDSSIADNTNEVNITKRLFLNTGGQSILLTPNLGGSVNRIESSNLPLEIFTSGSELRLAAGGVSTQVTLTSTGNFLIGTTTDSGLRLDVNGAAIIRSNLTVTATNATGDFATIDVSNTIRRRTPAQVLTDIGAQGALTNPVTGTGTTNYLPKFTGSTTIGNSILQDSGTRLTQNTGDGFVISTSSSDTVGGGSFLALANSTQTRWILQQINASFGLDWWSFNGTSWSTRMQLTAGGNLLVGTTTDAGFKLDVAGSSAFRDTLTLLASGVNAVQLSWTGSNTGLINLLHSGSLTTQILASGNSYFNGGNVGIGTSSPLLNLQINSASGSNSTLAFSENNGLKWYTRYNAGDGSYSIVDVVNSATRLIISTGGNLGLGVTPSAGGLSGYVLFELANGGASIYSGPNQNLNGSNISWSGGTASYKISNFATLYNQQSGQHQWFNAPSGTAGNAITFTQAMTLDASGNLGIGIPNPSNRLQITAAAGSSHARWTESATTVGFVGGAQGIITGHNGKFAVRAESGLVLSGSGNSADVVIASGGNLLVGTTTDNGARLNVSGRLFVLNQVIANNTITDPTNDNTLTNGTVYALNGVSTINNFGIGLSAIRNGNYDIWFQTGSINGGGYRFYRGTSELVTITNGGNVGIGTSSPASRLQIEGTGTGAWLTINRTDSGTNVIDYTQSGTRLGYIGYIVNDLFINNSTASSTVFFTNGSERMRITSGGQIQYPNTGNNSSFVSYSSNQDRGITNFYQAQNFPSSNAYTRVFDITSCGDATGGGAIRFLTSAPNSAPSSSMLINTNGNVLIGTTTDAGYKLDVNGSIRVSQATTTGGSVSNPFNTWTTIFSPSVGEYASYLVYAFSPGNGADYCTTATVVVNSSAVVMQGYTSSAGLVMRVSGGAVQVLNGSGVTVNVQWKYLKLN
jgi:predicted heme/steroid binding protein